MAEVKKVVKNVLETQEQYAEDIALYQSRLEAADTKHSKKFEAIKESRQYMKQILPEFSQQALFSNDAPLSNNNQNNNRSTYCPPLPIVIGNKMLSELTSMPMRFEYEANGQDGIKPAKAFMKIIQRTFSQTGNMSEHLLGIMHLIYSGLYIAQPVIQKMDYKLFDKGESPTTIDAGYAIGFKTYDPLTTVLDPNSVPGKVAETSDWLVVTIGLKTPQWIEKEYGIKVEQDQKIVDNYGSKTTISTVKIDTYKYELQSDSGLDYISGFMVREYYTSDGYVYHIIDDSYVARKSINSAGIVGIPFAICPGILDLDSPYGIPLPEHLRPSVELVATAINMVADNTALKNKLPYLYPNGLFDPSTLNALASGEANKMNNYVAVNLASLVGAAGYFNAGSIKDLVQKPELQEVTEGAEMLLVEGMNSIWFVTGLNPSSVSGIQDKQIRVESVANMIGSASLRNSSSVVVNLETYFLNPMTRFFQLMYYNYFDVFKEFKDLAVEKNDIKNIKSVRVVNGSYLPSDKETREKKAMFIYTMASQNQVFDPIAAVEYVFESMGMEMLRFLRNPLDLLTEEEAMSVIETYIAGKTGQPQPGGENVQQ